MNEHPLFYKALLVFFIFFSIQPLSRGQPDALPDTMDASLVASSLKTILDEAVHPRLHWQRFPDYKSDLKRLYQSTDYRLIWICNGKPIQTARTAIHRLSDADAQGLKGEDYDAKLLQDWLTELETKPSTEEEQASFDVAVTLSLMRYASSLYKGRINPRNVNFGLSLKPKNLDLPAIIERMAQEEAIAPLMESLELKLPLYKKLIDALADYREMAKRDLTPEITFSTTVRPGEIHQGMAELRRFLIALGDLSPTAPQPAERDLYDQELVKAVKRFQERHGLAVDGIIGKNTLAQLNIPITARIKQIQLALERLRWLPERFHGPFLIVNIPSFELYGFHDGSQLEKPAIVMNVIVGQAVDERNTPIFHADMRYVGFRPYWNVPYSITVKEMLPRIERDSAYLVKKNLEIVDRFAPNAKIFAPTPETLAQLRSGILKLRQKPGPSNELGLVKFIFPNRNNVYLHSTPAVDLFNKARRDFSHGCIRVKDPVDLAEFVLKNQGGWSRERILNAMNGAKTVIAPLKSPLPVYIFYSTVLVDEQDKLLFFDDIYGHDTILQTLLDKGYPYPS